MTTPTFKAYARELEEQRDALGSRAAAHAAEKAELREQLAAKEAQLEAMREQLNLLNAELDEIRKGAPVGSD